VLIGKDTRISGYMIESALEAGFASAGVDVLLSGPLPTPGVAYLTRALRLDLGVVISASHNAYADNGIKFFSAAGAKLPDAWELAVEAALDESPAWVDSAGLGRARRLDDAGGRYVEFCKSTFASELSLKGMKLVVDAAHGAAYQVAPNVFHELGAEVVRIGCAPDGMNINDGFGATSPKALVAAVAEHDADYGIALDGDADRLQMVDAAGRLFNGDELLYLMVADRLGRGEKVAGAVGTLMTNMSVEVAFKAMNVPFVRAKVGDRYVLEELGAHEGLGPFARARQTHHRRRHRQRLAGVGGRAARRQASGLVARRRGAVSANADQRAHRSGQRLAGQPAFEGRADGGRARTRQQWPRADPCFGHRAAVARDGRGARCGASQERGRAHCGGLRVRLNARRESAAGSAPASRQG
jgi:hypothetical protein